MTLRPSVPAPRSTALFPAPAVVEAPPVTTFEDVERHVKVHGPDYLLQALRTLQSHCRMAPLSTLAADLGWFLGEFPKSSRQNPMPRSDLGQGLEAYKKWHADIRRALAFASGARAAKAGATRAPTAGPICWRRSRRTQATAA